MRRLAAALLAMLVTPVAAQYAVAAQDRVVVSPAPDRVALTVYRAPYGKGAIDLRYLNGFALVTETRRIRVPRGAAVLRFEGVAEGIVPVSAVVEGLPGGIVEKNRDARLLSPASLIDGTLGRRVTLTRTDRATGRTASEEATIVAGPAQGVVLKTSAGIETLRCSGLAERLSFGSVPAGLSSTPVLSVTTTSPAAHIATVRLSYIASGFDWRASYVATVAAEGRTLDLFAWLTLANGNAQTFADAQVSAVAGRLNRASSREFDRAVGALRLSCYPLGTTTSDLRSVASQPAEIVVTASRRVMTMHVMAPAAPPAPPPPPPPPPPPEDLGDLKLYRVPERVTVGARGQKQVALLAQAAVPFDRRYRRAVDPGRPMDPGPTAIVLVLNNRKDANFGVPLPSGSTATYAMRGDERLLLGLGTLTDRAEGETFRIAAGISTQVQVAHRIVAVGTAPWIGSGPVPDPDRHTAVITITNAAPYPAQVDIPIGAPGDRIVTDAARLQRIDGIATWSVTIAAGGRAELAYWIDTGTDDHRGAMSGLRRYAPESFKQKGLNMARTAEKRGKDETKAAEKTVKATGKPAGGARGGITAPVTPSPDLAEIVGKDDLPRSEVVKKVWDYIKKHDLQDAKDRRQINADDALGKIFGKKSVSMFEMNKHLSAHLTAKKA